MSLFAWIFGRKSAKPLLSEILDKFSSDLEPVLQRHFLDYQKKIGLLSRFESSQVKSRDFKKKLKKLFSLPARGQIGSFEKKEIAGILSLLSSAVDKEQNPDIKDLEKEEQILLAAFSEQIDRLAGNLEAQHSWIAEHLSDVESYEDVVGLKELLIKEGRILYEIEKKELPRIHSELDLILSRTSYPEGSSMADKMLKEKLRRKKMA